jgi:hypothetical protein
MAKDEAVPSPIEKTKDGEIPDYEIESAVSTLQRAEEIKADKKLMKALQPFLKKKVKSIEDLRKLSSDMGYGDDEEDSED